MPVLLATPEAQDQWIDGSEGAFALCNPYPPEQMKLVHTSDEKTVGRSPSFVLIGFWRWQCAEVAKTPTEHSIVPKMSDSRRKRIQAAQRKASNALRRAAKAEKRKRRPGATAG